MKYYFLEYREPIKNGLKLDNNVDTVLHNLGFSKSVYSTIFTNKGLVGKFLEKFKNEFQCAFEDQIILHEFELKRNIFVEQYLTYPLSEIETKQTVLCECLYYRESNDIFIPIWNDEL